MKKEYVNEDNHSTMFAQPNSAAIHHPHTFHVANNNIDSQPSEEISFPLVPSSAFDDGSAAAAATIERAYSRRRGRPRGSKNKPKQQTVIITHETNPSMKPYVLEIPAGFDIVETVVSFCRRRKTDLCILNGTGSVNNVTLRQPSTDPGASVTFHGRFDVLSLSATILAGNVGFVPSGGGGGITNGFTITLAGSQGQVMGGAVVGPLYSAGTVYLVATTFNTPVFQRLPLEDEEEEDDQGSYHQQSSPVVSCGGAAVVEGGGMEGYDAYNLPS